MKNLKYFLAIIFTSLLFASCSEDLTYQGSPRVKFGPGAAGTYAATFYVQPDVVNTYDVEIQLVSVPLDVPTTFQINVLPSTSLDPSARAGIDYILSASTVTIPAGSNTAKVTVTGYFEGLKDGTADVRELVLEVIGTDGVLSLTTPTAQGSARGVNTFVIKMRVLCPFVPEDFEGIYEVYERSGYEPTPYPLYDVEVTLVSVDNGIATYEVVGLWEYLFDPDEWAEDGWDQNIPVTFIIDGRNPLDIKVNIPKQPYTVDGDYGQLWFEERSPGTASSCDLIIETNYKVYVAAGFFDQVIWSIWTKK